jgi:hypothetical protein
VDINPFDSPGFAVLIREANEGGLHQPRELNGLIIPIYPILIIYINGLTIILELSFPRRRESRLKKQDSGTSLV